MQRSKGKALVLIILEYLREKMEDKRERLLVFKSKERGYKIRGIKIGSVKGGTRLKYKSLEKKQRSLLSNSDF